MVLDPEAQQKFSIIDKDICELKENDRQQAERLINLEKQFTRQDEKLTNVENGMVEIKSIISTNNATTMSLLSQLVITKENNNSQEKISKFDNLTKISLGLLGLIGTVLASMWAGSKLVGS